MEWGHWKMFHADNEKRKKETIEGIRLSNQESIKMLGKKENSKYLRILEMDTTKQIERKKNKKITPDKNEKTS